MRSVKEPSKPFAFEITDEHVKRAKPRDPCNCVVAQALADTGRVMCAEVNACITTIIIRGGAERYQTPPVLRKGLQNFDNTEEWNLPAGVYHLLPVAKSQTRKAIREAARKRRAAGDANMFHDRSIYPRRKQNLSPRQITHRDLMRLEAVA